MYVQMHSTYTLDYAGSTVYMDCLILLRYQHSRHLVNALNRFADQDADLPDDWEKKLNQQGKVRPAAVPLISVVIMYMLQVTIKKVFIVYSVWLL